MANRGGFSFVAMLVINPIVILIYQNCSLSPVSYAKNTTPPAAISRGIASVEKPKVADLKASKKVNCTENHKSCLQAE